MIKYFFHFSNIFASLGSNFKRLKFLKGHFKLPAPRKSAFDRPKMLGTALESSQIRRVKREHDAELVAAGSRALADRNE